MKKDFAGTYPIIFDGRNTGNITISREGLFWCFNASCEMTDEIIRLSVYGDGNEGYLGVMEPYDKHLKLSKKLSDASVSTYPDIITHAGKKGENPVILVENSTESPLEEEIGENSKSYSPLAENSYADIASDPPQDYYQSKASVSNSPPNGKNETECDESTPQICTSPEEVEICPPPEKAIPPPEKESIYSDVIWKLCPCPSSLFSNISAKSAFGSITGALMAETENGYLLAVPFDTQINPYFAYSPNFINIITINCKKYKICEINNINY